MLTPTGGGRIQKRAINSQLLHRRQCTLKLLAYHEATGQTMLLNEIVPGLRVVDIIEIPLEDILRQ